MAPDPVVARSRRAILAAGAAAAMATVAKTVVGPDAVAADTPNLLANTHNPIASTTYFEAAASFSMLQVTGPGRNLALKSDQQTSLTVESAADAAPALVALAEAGSTGVLAYSGQFPTDPVPAARAETGVFGTAYGGETSVGVYGQSADGTGVEAHSTNGLGLYATSTSFIALKAETTTGFTAIWGRHGAGGTGVEASSASGTGLVAASTTGKALVANGKVRLSRSGRRSLAANKTYVDVDLRSNGGTSSTALCFANLATYRSGVWVTAVRPNWPSAGYMRIYVNKVASTTTTTPISWLVLESS